MKKLVLLIACAIFITISYLLSPVISFADSEDKIEFCFEKTSFYYTFDDNKKSDSIFYTNAIRKRSLASTPEERKELLIRLHNAKIPNDIALNFIFPNLTNTIDKINTYIHIECRDANMKINSSREHVFEYTSEREGRELNIDKVYSDIYNKIMNLQPLKIDLNIIRIKPKVYLEELKKYTNIRADFSTDISTSSPERKHNIKNAINAINMTTIQPNEVFSFNESVGKRTEQNGYRMAKIIVNNEFVEGLGGGVCQVSTTLYNAALLSGMKIVEANKHSRPVSYVKSGFDAMVNYGSSDLKIKNNTNNQLLIIANYSPTKIRIRIYGEDLDDVKYSLVSEVVETYPASEIIKVDTEQKYLDKVVYDDEFFYEKKASQGMKVNSYRLEYVLGKITKKELLRTDIFTPIDAVKIYGSIPRESTLVG